jgi:hypothetical protein
MEGHKVQAISSSLMFERTFKERECMGNYPSRTEATFQHLVHNILPRRACALNASHILNFELPL